MSDIYRFMLLFVVGLLCLGISTGPAVAQFLDPPQVIAEPGPEYSRATRLFQGIPSLERSRGGRLWVVWYGGKGKGEDEHNYVMLASSGDDGATWSDETLVIDPDGDGPVRAFDPELWMDPDGRLWVFWAQTVGHDGSVAGVWAITTEEPDSANPKWSPPRRLTDGVMMCKPIVLSTGEWVLPASTWRDTDNSARMVVSTDRGKTWQVRGACNVPEKDRNYDEHIIVERKDGSLWMLVRTRYGIGESVSADRGRTWSPLQPSAIQHATARFFIRRLQSGNLLLVKHGPIDQRIGRSHLMAFISKDDGKTWEGGLLLDERKGVSYPDGIQAPDGTIYICYDYDRTGAREIYVTKFTEEEISRPAHDFTPPRFIVNKATGSDFDSDIRQGTISSKELALLPAKGPYFPCDERIIEDRWMVERFVVPFVKHADNPLVVKDFSWEGTGPLAGGSVLYDPQDGKFKMWYGVWDKYAYEHRLPFSYNICYAESDDGVVWRKPMLELFDRRGTMDEMNNCIKLGRQKTQGIDVEFNPAPRSPRKRFVAIHNDSGGVFVSYSPDGKNFDCSFDIPAVWYHSDTHNNFVYDEIRERWLMFVRPRAYAGQGLRHVNRRRVAVKESVDLVHWSHERTVLVPHEEDATDFYGMTVFRRGDLFFGLLQIYDAGGTATVNCELAWSADGYDWQRLPPRAQKRPLQLGAEGEWDAGQIYFYDKPVAFGDEMWFYYGGNSTPHDRPGTPAVGLARTRRDRLIGVRALPDTLGRLLTRPFRVNGDLFINAQAAGEIRVEVRSAVRDEPLDGWSADECTPFTGDELDAPIRWGDKTLSELHGRIIRLRFQLRDAALYAFDVKKTGS